MLSSNPRAGYFLLQDMIGTNLEATIKVFMPSTKHLRRTVSGVKII